MTVPTIHIVNDLDTGFDMFRILLSIGPCLIGDLHWGKSFKIGGQVANFIVRQGKSRHADFHPGPHRRWIFQEREEPGALDPLTNMVVLKFKWRRILRGLFDIFLNNPTFTFDMVASLTVELTYETASFF